MEPGRRDYRRKTLRLAKGFFLTKSKLNRSAQEAVEKALRYGYVGRRRKKRDFRSLWIVRIDAACRSAEISYSKFISGLKRAAVFDLTRKVPGGYRDERRTRIFKLPRRKGESR